MKGKNNAGFSLIEVLVAIAILAGILVPACSSLVLSLRMNAKAEALLNARIAVSSAVETLMAEGITEQNLNDYGWEVIDDAGNRMDRFPDVTITTEKQGTYYNVIVKSNDNEVVVTTCIRASEGGGA